MVTGGGEEEKRETSEKWSKGKKLEKDGDQEGNIFGK